MGSVNSSRQYIAEKCAYFEPGRGGGCGASRQCGGGPSDSDGPGGEYPNSSGGEGLGKGDGSGGGGGGGGGGRFPRKGGNGPGKAGSGPSDTSCPSGKCGKDGGNDEDSFECSKIAPFTKDSESLTYCMSPVDNKPPSSQYVRDKMDLEIGSPILLNRGEYFTSYVDLAFNLPDINFVVSREYNHKVNYLGAMGKSWLFNHEKYLVFTSARNHYPSAIFLDGRRKTVFDKRNTDKHYRSVTGGEWSLIQHREWKCTLYHVPPVENREWANFPPPSNSLSKVVRASVSIVSRPENRCYWKYYNRWFVVHNDSTIYTFEPHQGSSTYYALAKVKTLGNLLDYNYDSLGRLSSVVESNNQNRIDFSYGSDNRISTIADNYGRSIHYGYDNNANLVSVTDPLGHTLEYRYEDSHNPCLLTAEVNQNGEIVTEVSYTPDGEVASFTEFGSEVQLSITTKSVLEEWDDGRFKLTSIGQANLVTSQIESGHLKYSKVYDEKRRVVFQTDHNLQHVAYKYDENDNLIERRHLVEGVSFQYLTEADYQSAYESLTVTEAVTKTVTVTSYNAVSGQTRIYYQPQEFIEEKEIEIAKIRSKEPLEGRCEQKGLIDQLTHEVIRDILFVDRDLGRRAISMPIFRVSTDIDPDGCIYLSPCQIPGDSFHFTYFQTGSAFYVSSITDPDGNVMTYEHDDNGHLVKSISPAGIVNEFEYNSRGLRTKIIDGSQNVVEHNIYDPNSGQVVESKDVNGNSEYFTYDSRSNLISHTDFEGNVTTWEYDLINRIKKVIYPTDDSGLTPTVEYTYTPTGNIKTITDPNGNVTEYFYDNLDRRERVLYPDGTEVQYVSEEDRLKTLIDKRGFQTTFGYNELNQLTAVTDALGNTSTYTYDQHGHLLSRSNALGNVTSYVYDKFYRLKEVNAPENQRINFEYDSVGNITKLVDSDGVTITQSFINSELLHSISQLGLDESLTTTMAYDLNGHVVKSYTPSGKDVSFSFNDEYQMVAANIANNPPTSHAYDKNGLRSNYTNELDKTWTKTRDNLNRVTRFENPLGHSMVYRYDKNGNLVETTYPEGNKKIVDFDPMNRPTRFSYFNDDSSLDEEVNISYDSAGNVVAVTSEELSVFTSYDALDRVTFVSYPDLNRHISVGYDAVGNVTTRIVLNTLDLSKEVSLYKYDNDNRLIEMNESGNLSIFSYTQSGRLATITYPNGMTRQNSYDEYGRVSGIYYFESGDEISKFVYSYDKSGNVTGVESIFGLTQYFYNEQDRLREAHYPDGDVETFTYDFTGNIVARTLNGTTRTFLHDDANRLIQSGELSYQYDDNGSMTSRQNSLTSSSTQFSYSARNKLASVQFEDNTTASYEYYPLTSLRFKSTDREGLTSYTLYRGANENIIFSEDKTSISTIANVPGFADVKLYQRNQAETHFFILDAIRSVRAIESVSGNGAVENYSNYYAYGGLRNSGTLAKTQFSFTGRPYDKDTNLFYYRGRYYDHVSGTFLQTDPTYNGSNWYAYTGGLGNPVGFHDPSGYEIEDAIRGIQSALPSGSDIALGLILQVLSKANPATLVLFLGVDIYNRYEQLQQLAAAWDCDSERDFLLGQLVAELVLSKRKTRLDVPPPKLKGKGPGKSDNPTYCFVGHTLVHTSEGLKPIEFIEPGQRVITTDVNSEDESYLETAELVFVKLSMVDPHGLRTGIQVTMLQEKEWVYSRQLHLGSKFNFQVEELQVSGPAIVEGLNFKPKIEDGPGRLVLAKVESISQELIDLSFEGTTDLISVTPNHLFYHPVRELWIPANAVVKGTQLATKSGVATVKSVKSYKTTSKVFTLKVQSDKSYYVGSEVGLLSHNTGLCDPKEAPNSGGRKLPFSDQDRLTEVNKTLDRIEQNGPFPYQKDGTVFQNREGRLPEGDYREYTVDTPGATNRGKRRIVQDQETGRTFYTDDHYHNFVEIDPSKK